MEGGLNIDSMWAADIEFPDWFSDLLSLPTASSVGTFQKEAGMPFPEADPLVSPAALTSKSSL